MKHFFGSICSTVIITAALCVAAIPPVLAQTNNQKTTERPNILVIMTDDMGYFNLSAYNRGAMGYRTPNIDSLAADGALFTDMYAQPSCTAGRASFITGMYPIRSGLTSVGVVGSDVGIQQETPTLAEVLKTQGYATGQFGKNHLGDKNEFLPTVHGFDEFYGFLYHLNEVQENLDNDYPTDPEWLKKHQPRGIVHSFAADTVSDKAPSDPRWGPVGKQRVKDLGLPQSWDDYKTLDATFNQYAFKFMEKSVKENKPFFVWLNPSRMHVFTAVPDEYKEKVKPYTSYDDPHGAGMMQLDDDIGSVLQKLESLGIADKTIVVLTTDNGPEHSTYPYGGTTPFKWEKMTTWEGGVRVPTLIRWPGHIKPGTEINGIQTTMDIFATLATAGGYKYDELREKLKKGDKLGTDTVKKAYLDGEDMTRYWADPVNVKSPRDTYIYWAASELNAIRINQWKAHFQTRNGYYGVTTTMDIMRIYNLRQDPFESFDQWPRALGQMPQHKLWLLGSVTSRIQQHLKTLKDFPPPQKGSSLSIEKTINRALSTKALAND